MRALIKTPAKPAAEPLAADRPVFLVPVHVEAGVANIILVVEQFGRGCQLDQDVRLLLLRREEIAVLGLFLLVMRRRWLPNGRALTLLDQPGT